MGHPSSGAVRKLHGKHEGCDIFLDPSHRKHADARADQVIVDVVRAETRKLLDARDGFFVRCAQVPPPNCHKNCHKMAFTMANENSEVPNSDLFQCLNQPNRQDQILRPLRPEADSGHP